MARTFNQMVAEALAEVPVISAAEAQRRLQADPRTLVIDPRGAADIPAMGMILGAMNISCGALTYKADHEPPPAWRAPALPDRTRPLITACQSGPLGALAGSGGQTPEGYEFSTVSVLKGGTQAWKEAGIPAQQAGVSAVSCRLSAWTCCQQTALFP